MRLYRHRSQIWASPSSLVATSVSQNDKSSFRQMLATPVTGPRTEAYERLRLDGGWLTAAQLAMECGQSPTTVAHTLHRQVRGGHVESRVVYLGLDTTSGYRGARDRRVEFKAL